MSLARFLEKRYFGKAVAYFSHLYNHWSFGRNIAKNLNHTKTLYVAFESWNCQLRHHIRIIWIQLMFFLDIHAERSAIAQSRSFSRNIAKTIYRIITFLDSFESWHRQATRLIIHRGYLRPEATTVHCGSRPQCLRSHRDGLCRFS